MCVCVLMDTVQVSKLLDLLVGETSRDKHQRAEHKNVPCISPKQSMSPFKRAGRGWGLSTRILKEMSNRVWRGALLEAPYRITLLKKEKKKRKEKIKSQAKYAGSECHICAI